MSDLRSFYLFDANRSGFDDGQGNPISLKDHLRYVNSQGGTPDFFDNLEDVTFDDMVEEVNRRGDYVIVVDEDDGEIVYTANNPDDSLDLETDDKYSHTRDPRNFYLFDAGRDGFDDGQGNPVSLEDHLKYVNGQGGTPDSFDNLEQVTYQQMKFEVNRLSTFIKVVDQHDCKVVYTANDPENEVNLETDYGYTA